MDLEPATGTTFEGALRLQAATMVNRTASGGCMTSVFYPELTPQVLVPLYWINECASISSHDLDLFKQVQALYTASLWTLYIGPALFGLIAVCFTIWTAKDRSMCCAPPPTTSSLLISEHSKPSGYHDQGTWSERCSLAQEYAKSCTHRISCARSSAPAEPSLM